MTDQFGYTVQDTDGVTYEPWTNGHAVGFKCTNETTGTIRYLALNPSLGSTDGVSSVFVYLPEADPEDLGEALTHITPFYEEQRTPDDDA